MGNDVQQVIGRSAVGHPIRWHLSMKYFLFLLLLPGAAVAQQPAEMANTTQIDPSVPQWTLQIDPLTTALGLVHLQVEHALDPHWSLYVGPNFRLFDGLLDKTHQPYTGLGVEMGLRYFWRGEAPQGPWLQVRGVVAHLSSTDPIAQSAIGGYGSALVGYTAIFQGHWLLAGGLGVQYMAYHLGGYGFGGVLPAAHSTIGFAW